MKIHHFFIAVCALSLLAFATPSLASAQTPDRLTQLDISVWPEFDDPRVLVQYDGSLATQSAYPHEIAFYIPATAALTATAYLDESQQFLKTDPAVVSDAGNGLKRVTFQLPKPHFHLEYYDDVIKGGPDKSFQFVYTALLPADSVQIQVQQPLKAESFEILPAAAMISNGMHDFKYHIFNYTGTASGQTFDLKINYTKADPKPSLENVAPPESAPQTNPAETTASTDPIQLYTFVGAGIVLALALLALFMWYMRRQPRLALAGVNTTNPGGRRIEHATAFCSQCGNPLHSGDNFCPKCGAKKR